MKLGQTFSFLLLLYFPARFAGHAGAGASPALLISTRESAVTLPRYATLPLTSDMHANVCCRLRWRQKSSVMREAFALIARRPLLRPDHYHYYHP